VKAWVLAAGLILAPAAASAGTLIAGAVRDTDGFVVAGATIVAEDGAGRIVGHGATSVDGTFAIDADGVAAELHVSCTFCVAQRVAIGTEPPAIAVVRYAALRDRTPSPDDIAALPYDRLGQVAALVPFALVTPYGISDRGLGAGNGATTVDGIAYYRISDGRNFFNLLPNGTLTALGVQPARFAPVYGQPAGGGLFDAATLGTSALTLRGGGTGGAAILDASGPVGAASFAESLGGTIIRRATGRFDAAAAGGAVSLTASTAANGNDAAAGTALRYAIPLRAFDALASVTAAETRSAAVGGTAIGSSVHADTHLHGRGPATWDAGLRLQTASGAGPGAVTGVQGESALYADAQRTMGRTTVSAAFAVQSDSSSAGVARWWMTSVLPALHVEHELGGGFALHASTTAAIRDPYAGAFGGAAYVYEYPSPFSRLNVVDAGLSYTDARRLRIDGIAYAQRGGDPADHVSGLGLELAWQATPHLALRSWALAAEAGADISLAPTVLYGAPPAATGLRRQVMWITYRNGFRLDVLDRGSGIDGAFTLPLGRSFTVVAGTFGRVPGRAITVELRMSKF
jgi:hypothetical protein